MFDLGVQSEKAIHNPGLGEDVSRVAQLRAFDDNSFLNVENVFIAKQTDPARPAGELAIEERDRLTGVETWVFVFR